MDGNIKRLGIQERGMAYNKRYWVVVDDNK